MEQLRVLMQTDLRVWVFGGRADDVLLPQWQLRPMLVDALLLKGRRQLKMVMCLLDRSDRICFLGKLMVK